MNATRLKPWRLVAHPHDDVLENRFHQSEFAADLTAVDLCRAPQAYQDAQQFFSRTFLSTGLRQVLQSAIDRLTGRGGEPVISLQAMFGTGKTHTMLALRHLAQSSKPARLPGIQELLDPTAMHA